MDINSLFEPWFPRLTEETGQPVETGEPEQPAMQPTGLQVLPPLLPEQPAMQPTGLQVLPLLISPDEMVTQTIILNPGWNWISFYVNLENTNLTNLILSDIDKFDMTLIKPQKGEPPFSQYYKILNPPSWYPTNIGNWENTKGFRLKNNSNINLEIYLTALKSKKDFINLEPGWNWIGFVITQPILIKDLIPNGKDGYFIKNKKGNFSQFYSSLDPPTWYPETFEIKPGEGYSFKLDEKIFSQNDVINFV